jgi:hypothetical protein
MKLLDSRAIALAAIATLSGSAARAQPANDARRQQVAANFREADADGDGALNRVEFAKLIDLNARDDIGHARRVARLNRYDTAFGRADANADGGVTAEELSASAAPGR